MDHKTFSAYTLKADQQQGVVESIVAVMGNDDQGDDVIHNGAFLKTITERRGKIRVLDQHQTDSIMRAIGKPLELREIPREQLPPDLLARYPTATGGLYTKTQYLMDTPEGRGAFQRIASGAVDEYSIGYDPLDVDYSKLRKSDGTEKTVRNLRTIKLYEYSPVLFGMNDATQTLSAKGATGAAGLPLADRARAWDSTAANARVRTWADATDAPNAKYRDAFFWYDASAPDNFTSYKLQFADVIDGKLTAIPRGIFAVAAVLQGSRGGVDIPAGDKDAIKSKVSAYYSRMRKEFDDESIVAPWDSKQAKPFGAALASLANEQSLDDAKMQLHKALCESLESIGEDGSLDVTAKMQAARESLAQYSDAMIGWFNRALGSGMYEQEIEMPQMQAMSATRPFEIKVGRIFASRNLARLEQMKDLIEALLADAATVPEEEPTDEAPAKRAALPDAPAQAGPTISTSPTDEALRASIEIELAELKLMEV